MTSSEQCCYICSQLRDIRLHIYELSLFCELLANKNTTLAPRKDSRFVSTKTISDWLLLCSQLDCVNVNSFSFEVAALYCGPSIDQLNSRSNHHESIATPLTRFLYVSYALEEAYRFANPLYERLYRAEQSLRDFSAQASYILSREQSRIKAPKHYEHLVDNYRKRLKMHIKHFPAHIDQNLERQGDLSYGLNLVRNVRNHIAHGMFPIIEDPDYDQDEHALVIKRNMIELLLISTRIAALNIQMLLGITSPGFTPNEKYSYFADDLDYGHIFRSHCTFDYLRDLHTVQNFALNENDFYQFCEQFADQ